MSLISARGISPILGNCVFAAEGAKIIGDVKIGDKVIFAKYSGQTVKLDGKELLVMREDDIFGVIA